MILDFNEMSNKNSTELLTEMEENFFNKRITDVNVNGYVSVSTYRAFRHKSKFAGGVANAFKKAIPLITKSFDDFVILNKGSIDRDSYDKWHKTNLSHFIDIINKSNVVSASESLKNECYYNTYAKPFNLLIWHHSFGKANLKYYDRKNNYDLAYCLHPAIDKELLKGIKIVSSKIDLFSLNIPNNATMGWINSEEKYLIVLKHVRSVCDKFINKNTGKTISPLSFESFWRMKNL